MSNYGRIKCEDCHNMITTIYLDGTAKVPYGVTRDSHADYKHGIITCKCGKKYDPRTFEGRNIGFGKDGK